ncbi:MAG TPA: MlaD family protein [Bryobacteraceae bacterium]|jgi:phospholipid/cholesterol/gamma-HCH transport system substrate-binding protein|nr:MlaD family protein [Bryobacteraceae bacterium]
MPSAQFVRWAKFRVLALVVSSLTILSVLLSLLVGGHLFRPKAEVRVYVPDASGLAPQAPVRLNGIEVGAIEAVRFSGSSDPNRVVEVVLLIEQDFLREIPRDSVSVSAADNMMGDQYIDITKGKSRETLRAGEELRFQPAPDLMKQIDITQFEAKLRAVDQLLADMQANRNPFGVFLNSDTLYQDTVGKVAGLEKDIRTALAVTGDLGQLIYRDTAHRDLTAQLRQLDAKLAEFEGTPLLNDPAQYDQARGNIEKVRHSIEDLEQGPWLKDDSMYQSWSKGVASLVRAVDDLNTGQMLADSQPYESWNGSLREMEHSIRDFRTDPRKYLRLKIF